MKQKQRKAAWWQMFASVPLMLALLIGETRLDLPQWAQEVVMIGIVIATFGVMLIWLHINAELLYREEFENGKSFDDLRITVYEPSSRESNEDSNEPKRFGILRPTSARAGRLAEPKDVEKWQLN